MLLSKIDNEEAAGNVDEIMERTDAVLLAKGSPGVDQPKMIEKANAFGKPIVTAIQILGGQTTTYNDDLTNAVLDCTTDCVMLLGDKEEAHPDIVLERISSFCKELESSIDYKAVQQKIRKALPRPLLPMARKAAIASWKYTKAKAIITPLPRVRQSLWPSADRAFLFSLLFRDRCSLNILRLMWPVMAWYPVGSFRWWGRVINQLGTWLVSVSKSQRKRESVVLEIRWWHSASSTVILPSILYLFSRRLATFEVLCFRLCLFCTLT